jgi:hypothetical protein
MVCPVAPQRFYTNGVPHIPYAGVNWDASKRAYEGVECYAPEWRMIAKRQVLASIVNTDFLRVKMSISKTVNCNEFRGFPPGTVLFLGADFDESFVDDGGTVDNPSKNFVVDITYQFIVEPNLVGSSYRPFPGLPLQFYPPTYEGIPFEKLGHEYMWVSSYQSADGPKISQINVAPMYGMSDFSLLGLGY